jgi:radical SAM protein with 4Fe4S-binding SPASM domain
MEPRADPATDLLAAALKPQAYAVWEITLRCNLGCIHCGSRAGPARDDELTTAEALDLVQQLADIGITEVTLIGGEAYLRRDWEVIAGSVVDAGMFCSMTTGGWGINPRMAGRIEAAGISSVSVSVDGLETTHDHLRGREGSWRWCFDALANLKARDLIVASNTQLNRRSMVELPTLYRHLHAAGIDGWQVQLTGPMGNAADQPELILQPAELPVAYDILARVARRAWADGILVGAGLNVGYYGPHERTLRGDGAPYAFWQGPPQGLRTIGIESDGTVKPELTLPTGPYTAGNIRERSLRELIETPIHRFASELTAEDLWGFCRSCEYAEICLGGDPWMTHVVMGRLGNNPYCDHRARSLAAAGARERVELDETAAGDPYDFGHFRLVEEPVDAPWPAQHRPALALDDVEWPEDWVDPPPFAATTGMGRDVDDYAPADTPLPRRPPGSHVRRVGQLVSIKRRLDARDRELSG